MVDITSTISSTFALLGTASFMIIATILFLRISHMKASAIKNSTISKVNLGIFLGLVAIYASMMGIKLTDGTIINVREMVNMVAGMAGGPIAGTLSGIIGGIHRYTVGGATAIPCTVSTVLIGIIAGIVGRKISGKMYLLKL